MSANTNPNATADRAPPIQLAGYFTQSRMKKVKIERKILFLMKQTIKKRGKTLFFYVFSLKF